MKKQKDILPKSQLVSELKDCEFIKQPYLYATIGGDFTLTERSIMIELMNSLQDQFNQYLKIGIFACVFSECSVSSNATRSVE